MGRYVSGESWDGIYASPLSRAYDTAGIIAGYVGISAIHTDPRLKERNFGKLEGKDGFYRRQIYGEGPIPGAETWEEVQDRAFDAVSRIAREHPGTRLLVVAHGGVIGLLLHLFSNGEIVPGHPPLENLCMNMLTYDGNWNIEWYNRVVPELEALKAEV